ncbi:hypothetical protein [Lewinella sp. W8]|uniref:hypothetical protein n=1 Tax=Lewinella sp. W8 TaxID=2528208 RepID=UPI001068A2DC|nr:hypothetical protein [Lewinella sp. W8]MTB50365.1 hypothetical protein [Lewinella sp. W8]
MVPRQFLLWLHVLWCAPYFLGAQGPLPTPRIHHFAGENFVGGVQNWDVTQDEAGFVYVANAVGVLRYDGGGWQTLPLPNKPTVRAVAASGTKVYAGGFGELGYFAEAAGLSPQWRSLSGQLMPEDKDEEIWHIEVLPDGRVVFQSFGRLFIYDGENMETVLPPGVMMFATVVNGELLVPVTGSGVYRWEGGDHFVLLPGTEGLGEGEVIGLTEIDGVLLIGTADAVYQLDGGQLLPWWEAVNELLAETQANRLCRLRDGRLAIGTINGGVFFVDPQEGLITRLNERSGLANNTVLAMRESRFGNLWLGLDRGLDMVDRSRAVRYHQGEDRPPGTVYAAANFGELTYFGTNQGLYWWSPRQKQYRLVPGTAGQVWELRPLEEGLLCGHNEGTFLVQDSTARLISDRSGGWCTLPVADKPGQLLQATYTGLQLLEIGEAGVSTLSIDGFSQPIRYLAQTGRREYLALHGSRGGFHFSLSEDCRTLVSLDTLPAAKLVKASLTTFGDTLLVQNAEGVWQFSEGELRELESFRGVPLKPGNYCLNGRSEGTWFLYQTDRIGVYRGSNKIIELPIRLRFPFPEIIPWNEEEFLFLLTDGYAQVSIAPEINDNAPLRVSGRYGTPKARRELRVTEEPAVLDYVNNDLVFRYSLPVYDRPVNYRTRLVGYSTGQWSSWSPVGTRSFTSLPAGKYCFEVEANWFERSARVCFEILPPWYLSVWAYAIYTTLFLVLLILLYRWHLARLRRQARRMEVQRQREVQRERIQARNRELRADVRRKSEELANTTLTLAKKNEMLIVLKEEIAKARKRPEGTIDYRKMEHLIERNLNHEEDWAIFESHFNEVHEAFLARLRKAYPKLTTGDLRLAAYLKMDLSSKEIAPLLHISLRGVENKRYRLRKKLALDATDDLNRFLLDF